MSHTHTVYNFTRTEQIIFQTVANRESLPLVTVQDTYSHYLISGQPPKQEDPQWKWDLWRDANERKHYHNEG